MENVSIKKALIDSAIHVVAENGIDRTTTKALSSYAHLNEVYIYRVCNGKDHLLRETFDALDDQFVAGITRFVPILLEHERPIQERCWDFFRQLWEFTCNDHDKCAFFIRYYHSRFFNDYPIDVRRKRYGLLLELMNIRIQNPDLCWYLLNHFLDVLFSAVLKVLRGQLPENEMVCRQTFNLIYTSLSPYYN